MDWQLAIHRNRDALLRIIAALVVLAGLAEGRAVISRHLHSAILRILRPAESAVRRLIMIAARGINFGDSLPNSSGVAGSKAEWWKELNKLSPKFSTPSFNLIDPLKRFAPSANDADDEIHADEESEDDTAFIRTLPRISVPGVADPVFITKTQLPDGMINARHLADRLTALKNALDNLQGQARRLARWQARRNHLRQQFPLRPLRLSPIRPGLPPGHLVRQPHEVHEILSECHGLVLDWRAHLP
jgi:hypothetical protein